jgi:hypothetical protein
MVPKRHRINQSKRCQGCGKKGILYLTKSTNVAFCFGCVKQNHPAKIRASLCTRCGWQRRTRRLPLHSPKKQECSRCSWDMPLFTGSFIGKVLTLSGGVALALAFRHRYNGGIDLVTSLTFWLLAISGAIFFYFSSLVVEERFHRNINKELIHGAGFGSMLGLGLWISGIFFTANFLTWLACLSSGAIVGILYVGAKRVWQYLERSDASPD